MQNLIKFTVPENTRRDAHKTRKPLSQPEISKNKILKAKLLSKNFFLRKKSHSAEKGDLSS